MLVKSRGQSMVEMALLLPFLLMLIFGIIEMGWYVYGVATLTQAARNAAEAAAQLPPFPATLKNPSLRTQDPCYTSIVQELNKQTVLFSLSNSVRVSYPDAGLIVPRDVGNPIVVEVSATIKAITPLPDLVRLSKNGIYTVTATSVRSIEALGNTPPSDEFPNGVACLEP